MSSTPIESLVEIGKKVKEELALRTYPLGIKFCKGAECEKEFERVKARRPLKNFNAKMPVCQLINISRTYGWVTAMSLEDAFCIAGARVIGLIDEIPEYLIEDIIRFHAKDREAGMAILKSVEAKSMPPGSVSGILISPLTRISFEPDVIVVYGTPTQIAKIAKAFTWHGILPETEFSGAAACANITKAYLTGKPQINIPCSGEVLLGRTEEDEISIAFPAKLAEHVISGLEGTRFIMPYPPPKYALYEPRVPSVYRMSYKDYEEWKKKKVSETRET
jgi:uncharacterized protein (DUF169 family)